MILVIVAMLYERRNPGADGYTQPLKLLAQPHWRHRLPLIVCQLRRGDVDLKPARERNRAVLRCNPLFVPIRVVAR
jgi:hypothetical protein